MDDKDEQPSGMRRLPTVTICGVEFFVDERLMQIRNVGNPLHSFDLRDPFER